MTAIAVAPPAAQPARPGHLLDALPSTLQRLTQAPRDPAIAPGPAPAREAALLRAILARPWRRSAADPDTQADITRKLTEAIRDQRPIGFSVPFGGYKNWQLASFPHVDWAEVFWIRYLRQYGESIASLYPPGVEFDLTYLRGVLGWINNLRQADQDCYLQELEHLLQYHSTPAIRLRCVDLTERHGGLARTLEDLRQREPLAGPPSPAQLASAGRNLVRHGGEQELGPLAGEALEQAVATAARRCLAMESLETRRAYNKYGTRIQLTHIRGASLAVHLGSCRGAVAQPWAATGYLTWHDDREWRETLAGPGSVPKGLCEVSVDHALVRALPRLGRVPTLTPPCAIMQTQ